jgi:uncharacterized repeat protein (TIGR03803 family)
VPIVRLIAKLAPSILLLGFNTAHAQTFTTLYSFNFPPDGGQPHSSLVLDSSGNLYGTTYEGGASNRGTVFKLDTSDQETVLYSFAGPPDDGANPLAGLVRDSAGNLYGTTAGFGGTVFKVNGAGAEEVLHIFLGSPSDGSTPEAPLLRDSAGNLYGTTFFGGIDDLGTVFQIDSTNQSTILHSFRGGAKDGALPAGGFVQDPAGNFYTTTFGGGLSDDGTAFGLPVSGGERILHIFTGGVTDGDRCEAGLILVKGDFYGTASGGGAFDDGIIFKLDMRGNETVLYSFAGSPDGASPTGSLVADGAGNLYGTTLSGGTSNYGTLFRLDSNGTLSILYNFTGGTDGSGPYAGLVQDASGNLYGTTSAGGTWSFGTVFKLTP